MLLPSSYFCVAYLTHHRTVLLSCSDDPKEMKKTLQKLPSTTPPITMDVLEDLIEVSLSYLSHYPPSNDTTTRGDIHMMQPVVEWASSAPTDYALLQQAKAQRMSGRKTSRREVMSTTTSILQEKSNDDIKLFYPKAYVATGQVAARHRPLQKKTFGKMRELLILSLLLSILFLVLWNDGPVLVNTIRRFQAQRRRRGGFKSKKTAPSARAAVPMTAARMDASQRPPTEEAKRQAAAAAERTRVEAKAAAAAAEKARQEARAAAAEKARTEEAKAAAAAEKARLEAKAAAAAERAKLEAKIAVAKAKAAAAAAERTEKQEAARASRSRNPPEHNTPTTFAPSPILATAFQPSSVQQKLLEKKKLHQRPKGKPQPFRDFLTAIGRFFSKLFGVKLLSSS